MNCGAVARANEKKRKVATCRKRKTTAYKNVFVANSGTVAFLSSAPWDMVFLNECVLPSAMS